MALGYKGQKFLIWLWLMQREDFQPCHVGITSRHMSDPRNLRKPICFFHWATFTESTCHRLFPASPLWFLCCGQSPGDSASSRSHRCLWGWALLSGPVYPPQPTRHNLFIQCFLLYFPVQKKVWLLLTFKYRLSCTNISGCFISFTTNAACFTAANWFLLKETLARQLSKDWSTDLYLLLTTRLCMHPGCLCIIKSQVGRRIWTSSSLETPPWHQEVLSHPGKHHHPFCFKLDLLQTKMVYFCIVIIESIPTSCITVWHSAANHLLCREGAVIR